MGDGGEIGIFGGSEVPEPAFQDYVDARVFPQEYQERGCGSCSEGSMDHVFASWLAPTLGVNPAI